MATQPPILSKSGKKWAEKYVLLFLTFQGVAWTQIQFFVVLTWFHKKYFLPKSLKNTSMTMQNLFCILQNSFL